MQTCKWYRTPQDLIYLCLSRDIEQDEERSRRQKGNTVSYRPLMSRPFHWDANGTVCRNGAESSPNAIFTGTGCPLLSTKATSITSCHGGQWRWRADTKTEREKRFVYLMFQAVSEENMHFYEGSHIEVSLHNRTQWQYAHSCPEIPCKNIYTNAALWLEAGHVWGALLFLDHEKLQ